MHMRYLYGKTVVITGASSGIGRACALFFAERGYTVWALARRHEEKSETVGQGMIHNLQADVRNHHSIEFAVQKIEKAGPIGILIHCAGFGICGAAEDTLESAIMQQMDTNYMGVLRVNKWVMPGMRQRKKGLILVVGSMAGVVPIPFQSHYSSTKAALEVYVRALRLECRPYRIKACIIEPGDTRTDFANARVRALPEDSVYREACENAVRHMEKNEQFGKAPESVAKVAWRLSKRAHPPVHRAVCLSYKTLALLQKILPARICEIVVGWLYLRP